MKIFNKFILSKKEPSNKNDIWFDGSTWRMYTEEEWQSFTLPVDAADKVAKVLENASEVYQEKLNAGYGIVIDGNTISLDVSSINVSTTHNIGSIDLFEQIISERRNHNLTQEDKDAILSGKIITTSVGNGVVPTISSNTMGENGSVLIFHFNERLYEMFVMWTDTLCYINGVLSFTRETKLYADSELSETSENSVQNKAVTEKLTELSAEVNEVAEKIENLNPTPMISVTYAELVELRDNGELIAGMQYRITDYVTTTTQTDTESAGHPFDVIVTADSENTFNEVARAVLHEGDTYFAEAKLEAWQIWYCLDNDTSRFGWADAENGKGVIYRMIDEFDNDCPYDFKNIKFVRWELGEPTVNNAPGIFDIIIPVIISNLSPNHYKWAGSRMWDYPEEEYRFNNFFTSALTENTKSFFTFTDEQGTTDLSLAGTSHHNTIKENTFWDYEFFTGKWLNQIVLFNPTYFNNFEGNCHQLTLLGDYSCYNYFDKLASNIILIGAHSNTFGIETRDILLYGGNNNNFLGYNYDIVLCYSSYNTFMKDSFMIGFESYCEHNFIGEGVEAAGFRSSCNYNVIEGNSQGIFLFSNCTYNKFRKCIDIELSGIVNSPQCNTFEGCTTIRFSNGKVKNNTIKAGASNVTLVGNGTSSDEIRYIEVDGSIQGTPGSPIQVTVPVNANYSNKVAKKSDGTVVVYNEADLVN